MLVHGAVNETTFRYSSISMSKSVGLELQDDNDSHTISRPTNDGKERSRLTRMMSAA